MDRRQRTSDPLNLDTMTITTTHRTNDLTVSKVEHYSAPLPEMTEVELRAVLHRLSRLIERIHTIGVRP